MNILKFIANKTKCGFFKQQCLGDGKNLGNSESTYDSFPNGTIERLVRLASYLSIQASHN